MIRRTFSFNIYSLVFWVCICILTANCGGGKLSRSEAARLILADKNFSKEIEGDIQFEYGMKNSAFNMALISLGYVDAKPSAQSRDESIFTLTAKGRNKAVNWKPYKFMGMLDSYNIPYAKREVVEVTGISEPKSGDNFAQATFTWNIQPSNEIGKAMDKSSFEKNFEGEAFFQKFDDGWRIVRVSGRGIPGSE